MKQMVEALFEARIKYMKAENEQRIKTAMEYQANNQKEQLNNGDIVSYYRNGIKSEKGWKGPAKIIGIDNNTIIIRHGPQIIHAHMREVRIFRKGGTNDIPWAETGKEDNQMMTNETYSKKEMENTQTFVKSTTETKNKEKENQHGTEEEQDNKDRTETEKQTGNKQMMSKIYRPLWTSHQAYKSSNFPSPQLLVVATESISLEVLLSLKKQITKKGYFCRSFIDADHEKLQKVMDMLQQPETAQQEQPPPPKTRRIRQPTSDPIFQEIEERYDDEEEEDEVNSQLSETFARMETSQPQEMDSSSATCSEVTQGERSQNIQIRTNVIPSRQDIDQMKAEPNSEEDENGETIHGYIPPQPEPEISAGSEEDDTNPYTNNIRGVSKSTRTVRQTQFYGNPISSTTRGIFVCDYDMADLDKMKLTPGEKEFNPDLLYRSRCEEIGGWIENNVFEEVWASDVDPNSTILGTRWIDTWKQGGLGTKILKSRLVAKGNQENSIDLNTYAPTVSKEILMMLASLAATNKWQIESMDVEKAFLQSRDLQRIVYLKPPKEAVGNDKLTLWRLKTAVYGLADAAREWYPEWPNSENSERVTIYRIEDRAVTILHQE